MGTLRSLLTGGGSVSLGLVATAAGLALVTAATVTAGAALLKYGVAQADARRTELLRLEGLTKLRSIWGASAGSATELQAAIDRVSASSALGRGEIAGYATQLYKAGLRGDNLSQALEVSALRASVLGDASAEAWAGTASSIALAGGSVRKFADQTRARLGGIAAKQMLALPVIAAKLEESLGKIFDGVNIEGFLQGLKDVADLFDKSTATGRAMQVVLGGIFQPFMGSLESATVMAKRFFQGMTLGALDIAIGLAKAALWIKRTFGVSFKKTMDDATGSLAVGRVAIYAVAAALGTVTLAVGALSFALIPLIAKAAIGIWGLVAAGYALAAPFLGAAAAAAAVGIAVYKLVDWVQGVDWSSLGEAVGFGIIDGIESAWRWVQNAVIRLGDMTINAFKSALGIRSPSKEFAALGVQLPRGVESGIDDGQASLDKRVSAIVPPPSVPGSGSSAPARTATSARATVQIDAINIHTAASNARAMATDIRAALEDILSGVQVQIGAVS
jgi:hypothetical protein